MRRKPTDDKPQPSAFSKGLGMLTRREHSSREIKRKLAQKGYEREESTAALDKLQELDFQSDERFGGALIRTRIAQGYGPRRIVYEVRGHGLTDVEVRALIEAEAPDWLAIARANYRRKYGTRPVADAAERSKRAQFLLRRGFDAATVRTVTRADDVDDSAEEFE